MPKEEQHHEDDWDAEDASWEADAPLLASLKREGLADAPADYFTNLPDQVMARIRAEKAVGAGEGDIAVQTQPTRPWRTIVLLTSLLLLTGLGLALFWPGEELVVSVEEVAATQLEQVDAADILSELELSDLSEEELYDMLGQEAQAALDEEVSGFSQDNLLDYLDGADLDAAAWEAMDLDPNFFNEATQ